jgi:hypothetical protein
LMYDGGEGLAPNGSRFPPSLLGPEAIISGLDELDNGGQSFPNWNKAASGRVSSNSGRQAN